jgi:N-acetylmuramic acid 6-phosphate etherase
MNSDRSHLLTEQRLPQSLNLDAMEIADAVALMSQQDAQAAAAVATQAAAIAQAVRIAAERLQRGGRMFYVGAGSSGRLGVLDAAECPPTFSTDPEMIQGIIAGGNDAMFHSVEGAEDDSQAGAAAMDAAGIGKDDLVLGIAAGGTTPFVHGALARAAQRQAATIFLCCVGASENEPGVDLVIRPLTGPEILTGSTRLKAGTATKMVLNALSTLVMVQLGKVYENLMVDLRASNAKLRDRAARIVGELTGLDRAAAANLLAQAGGQVKRAVVMRRRGVDCTTADAMLEHCGGHLRAALQNK